MSLSFRRFPDTITRRRSSGPYQDDYGRKIDPQVTELEMACSVQPLALEDSDFAGGAQLVERLKCYIPSTEGDLQAAVDDGLADEVVYRGEVYAVEESRTWPKYTRAMLIRAS